MSKAYDRVEWVFLENMMLKLDFDVKWVKLVMLFVSSVRYQVMCNQFIGPIVPH